jgi:hypothetical protein
MKTIKPTQTATLKECVAQANKAEKAATVARNAATQCKTMHDHVISEADAYGNNIRRAIKMQIEYRDATHAAAKETKFFFWCIFILTLVNLASLFLR